MKSFINILLLCFYCFALLFFSCDTRNSDSTDPDPDTAPDTEITILTRANEADVVGENTLYNLWLIVYNEQGTQIEYCENLLIQTAYEASRITRTLTNQLTPGKKKICAIGNKPDNWSLDKTSNTPTLSTLRNNFKWQESDLPSLQKDNATTYTKINDKYVIDSNTPMRFSGYAEFEILPDTRNRIKLDLFRAVGKLEVEFFTEEDIQLTFNAINITVNNQAEKSTFLESEYMDDPPLLASNLAIEAETPLTLKAADALIGTEAKTIKTVPIYFFENHPLYNENTDVWENYNNSKHPLMGVAINSIQYIDNIQINGTTEDGTLIKGILRNHSYKFMMKVFVGRITLASIVVNPWGAKTDIPIAD